MWPGPTAAAQPTSGPFTLPVPVNKPEEDVKCEPEKQSHEYFSKSILLEKLVQYYAGKYTKRYIDAYLEFCHLSGYLSNLDYLDIKDKMSKE